MDPGGGEVLDPLSTEDTEMKRTRTEREEQEHVGATAGGASSSEGKKRRRRRRGRQAYTEEEGVKDTLAVCEAAPEEGQTDSPQTVRGTDNSPPQSSADTPQTGGSTDTPHPGGSAGLKTTGTQTEEPWKDQAQPKLRTPKQKNKETQTRVVKQRTQHTQTNPPPAPPQETASSQATAASQEGVKRTDDSQEEVKRTDDSQEEVKRTDDSQEGVKHQSHADSMSQTGKATDNRSSEEEPKPGQTAVSGGSTTGNSPSETGSPGPPGFTFYIYAILDRKFGFSVQSDTLLVLYDDGFSDPLEITLSRSLGKKGCLIEAKFSIEKHWVTGAAPIRYKFVVQKRKARIEELAERSVAVPCHRQSDELHLYVGHIHRGQQSWSLRGWFGLNQPAIEVILQARHATAELLLDRMFERLGGRSERLAQDLQQFLWCFTAANQLEYYPDIGHPQPTDVSELVVGRLLRFLRGDTKGPSQKSHSGASPLLVGLRVFQACCFCQLSLGVKGWAELCHLLTSNVALENQSLEEVKAAIPNTKNVVIGLMNRCARMVLAEFPLLVPLLHMLLDPGTEGGRARTGPTGEEENWAGLEGVEFVAFREKIHCFPDKRRMVLSLMKDHGTLTNRWPLVRTSWLSIVATEDLPEYSVQVGVSVEQLIQTLLYRVREYQKIPASTLTDRNMQAVQAVLLHVHQRIAADRESLLSSETLDCVLNLAILTLQSICGTVRLVPLCPTAVTALQLVLTVSEIQDSVLAEAGEQKDREIASLGEKLRRVLLNVSNWRDGLLSKPLLTRRGQTRELSYPRELQLWDALLGVECSIQAVSDHWSAILHRDLRERLTQGSYEDRVVLCCLEPVGAVLSQAHAVMKTCLQETCQAAISKICQAGKEGSLLGALPEPIPPAVLGLIVVQSASRFQDPVTALLDPQSAVHHTLSHSNWRELKLDPGAVQALQSAEVSLVYLLEALLKGHIPLGQLQTSLQHQAQVKQLYRQCRRQAVRKLELEVVDVEVLLQQRQLELQAFFLQREHIQTLLSMLGKISQFLTVTDVSALESKQRAHFQHLSLNMLVRVQAYSGRGENCGTATGDQAQADGQGYYGIAEEVLDMAQEMQDLRESVVLLYLWVEGAAEVCRATPSGMSLAQICTCVWQPQVSKYRQLGLRIAMATVTFQELDRALQGVGDGEEGGAVQAELGLMGQVLQGHPGLDPDWLAVRHQQILQYRQLHQAAQAAAVVLRVAECMELQGDFQQIHCLTQLSTESFQQRELGSLSEDLISAGQKLSQVSVRHTACLEAVLQSWTLLTWVKTNLKTVSDLKVFVDLAMISAGENDTEIDRVACFHDAIIGYSPLVFSLCSDAGFEEFMTVTKLVWDALQSDTKLPDKLIDAARWQQWLMGLRETHGSVEQSSLSLARAINSQGMYHVGMADTTPGTRCLQHLLKVSVKNDDLDRSYSLEELQELQNKLMLMSSKGDNGKEQVRQFSQVFEAVQRLGGTLLELQASGSLLFLGWEAEVWCGPEARPCILARFCTPGLELQLEGAVEDQLQMLSRSMELCLQDWRSLLADMRSHFTCLNHYTAVQLAWLSQSLHGVSEGQGLPPQLWHLLSPLKPWCSLADVQEAVAIATEAGAEPGAGVGHTMGMMMGGVESRGGGAEEIASCLESHSGMSEEEELLVDTEEEWSLDEDVGGAMSMERIWELFKANMQRFLPHHLAPPTLARALTCLSHLNPLRVQRPLPPGLREGIPTLLLRPPAEVLPAALGLYSAGPTQPPPSSQELLLCRSDTSEEEVELFLRRAFWPCSPGGPRGIYTLVHAERLAYDVSVRLGEHFEALRGRAGPQYRLAILCSLSHQHKYVPTLFSTYRVHAGTTVSAEEARRYLRQHLISTSQLAPEYPGQLSAWVVSSARPAVGKSLYVDRLFEKLRRVSQWVRLRRVRLMEPHVDRASLVRALSQSLDSLGQQYPVLLHIDTAAVRFGLQELLFELLVLGSLSDSEGNVWHRNSAHLTIAEVLWPCLHLQSQSKSEQGNILLDLLPTIHCRPPREVQQQLLRIWSGQARPTLDPLMDQQEFVSEAVQRPYQYLRRYNRNDNLDPFRYQVGSVEGDPVDCIHHLLANCGIADPSWAELRNFVRFLDRQLRDCEHSLFCDPDFLVHHLPSFKTFMVKFMVLMARDFATPSLGSSDQSPSLRPVGRAEADDLLGSLTLRKRWESQPHPYVFFNADSISMSFLGFHVKQGARGSTLNAVDPVTGRLLMGDVMSLELQKGLERQGISLSEDFDSLPRHRKIQRLCYVVGAQSGWEREGFDPDPSYELTADNVMKMLAIHMRFRCGIPVVVMGETGCGKTRLVRFLCELQREGRPARNMVLVKVHGGTTAEAIRSRVQQAEELALSNQQKFGLDTVLFFDEANATEAVFAIKEVLCDRSVGGRPLRQDSGLKIIAACNPYRRHSEEMIERLERAGLGYRVRAEETQDRLGRVPLRQLVYRVQPLPPSLIPLVWDFGQLTTAAELSYIRQMVQKQVDELPPGCTDVIVAVLAESQHYMRQRTDECSFVSLRDVERALQVLLWFYRHSERLFPMPAKRSDLHLALQCLTLAVGVCYCPSLVAKEEYLSTVCPHFPPPLNSPEVLQQEIQSCQDMFLRSVHTRDTVAKNAALRENVFLMVVCIELRIPLFLVGKPGSSKSLAKTVVADAMQGQASHSALFRGLKQVHMVSFQCSPHSSPEGIIGTFRQCARFQQGKSSEEYVSVVVLDEIGLAEDSPQMPLKTLHPLLEDGCIDGDGDSLDPHARVGFVGISNWALDPAKMNRGIFLSRWDPDETELVETAKGICSSDTTALLKIQHLFPKLAEAYASICQATDRSQFFGLRDFYSLVKMLFARVRSLQRELDEVQLAEAILRNFSGQPEGFDPLEPFHILFQNLDQVQRPSTVGMVQQNLLGGGEGEEESRYLLLLTTNSAALHILQHRVLSTVSNTTPEIVFGSGFPKDQEYANICRNVNRVKTCMETGRTVVLLNLQNLYESLYDMLNQYYVYLGGQRYVDLGLGTHRVKCRVHHDFRLVVVEDQKKVYRQFPVPLINRLEKHRLDRSSDLAPWQQSVLARLQDWVRDFTHLQGISAQFSQSDVFVGFHGDACASALLQALEERGRGQGKRSKGSGDQEVGLNSVKPMEEVQGEAETNQGVDQGQGEDGWGISMETADNVEVYVEEVDNRKQEEEKKGEKNLDREEENEGMVEERGVKKVETEEKVKIVEEEKEGEIEEEKGEEQEEEEEVLEDAKFVLLNCATPDAVLRLEHSGLANQERDKLQRCYFHLQHHRSLTHFLQDQLHRATEHCSFSEITTFSSLLTQLDGRVLAEAVGVASSRLLLLSLHQFDTEASFCSQIRRFLRASDPSRHILLVQTDVEESQCSDELIASAKYCAMNEVRSRGRGGACYSLLFITKLPRVKGCSQYIGFQGGSWLSVHIDDLRDSEDMSSDLSALHGTPISKILFASAQSEDVHGSEADVEEQKDVGRGLGPWTGKGACVQGLSLLRSCVQKAVSLLRDLEDMPSRSVARVQILLGLLGEEQGHTSLGLLGRRRFAQGLMGRIALAVAQREELMPSPGDWVSKESLKQHALQEGGTLRHTLWRCLQSTLVPVLARILAMLDRDANLDLLCCSEISEGLATFWLDILENRQILDLPQSQSGSTEEQEIDVLHHLRVGGTVQACAAPFSWLIRLHCQSLWEESQLAPGTLEDGCEGVLTFLSSFSSSRLGRYMAKLSEQESVEFSQRYLRDFVILHFQVTRQEEVRVYTSAVWGCVSELQRSLGVNPDLSPAWILSAACHYAPRLNLLSHALHLQPHLGPHLHGGGAAHASEMREDILALGMCMEEVEQHTLESLPECENYLQRVELLQPCVERAFSQNYSALCSHGCRQQLEAIRTAWRGALVVAAFIQQVVLCVSDSRLDALKLKYCALMQRLMQDAPDLRTQEALQQVIRILSTYHQELTYLDFRFGSKCPVCMALLSQPSQLPCGHVFCLPCLQRSIQINGHCPSCRAPLAQDLQLTECPVLSAALQQNQCLKAHCNSFFLELLSRFCLPQAPSLTEGGAGPGQGGAALGEGVVELLFSLLISSQGGVYHTRELSPLLDCVDQSPIVRSVLPKLLLQYSFEQVKSHIQRYLQNLKEHVLGREDETELYRLFVNCFQDCLCSPEGGGAENTLQTRLLDDTSFLSRFARKQTPQRQDDPVGFLLTMARLRICLGSAANLLRRAVTSQGEPGNNSSVEGHFLEQVRAVCEYSGHGWYQVYLLRELDRRAGLDCLWALLNSHTWDWVFPPTLLRLQRKVSVGVDCFLCVGGPYRAIRDAVGEVVVQGQTQTLQNVLQRRGTAEGVVHVALALALFRQVTCRITSPEPGLHLEPQEVQVLEEYLRGSTTGQHRELCISLLANQMGGPGSPFRMMAGLPGQRRSLLEILVHCSAVMQSGGSLLSPLQRLSSQPGAMRGSFLPSMPDDHTSEALQWMRREGRNVQIYYCANGHPCVVGECGRPMQIGVCPDCKAHVGGINHNPVQGFTKASSIKDETRTGHILGDSFRRSDAPDRERNLAEWSVLRLFTHLALLLGAGPHLQAVKAMIHPQVQDVREFLWQHLERDMEVLGRTLGQNMDNTALTIHLLLQAFLQHSTGTALLQQGADLSSRQGRQQWEIQVCHYVINPVIQGLEGKLVRTQELVAMDTGLSGSPLLQVLRGEPCAQLALPSDCPTFHSAFWMVPEILSIERLTQILELSCERPSVPLLCLYLSKVQGLRYLHHLPVLVSLQSDLLKAFPLAIEVESQSLTQVLQQIPAGKRTSLQARVELFMEVWNHVRMEIINSTEMGVAQEVCESEMQMSSSGKALIGRGHECCLSILLNFLCETHNSLVRQARRDSQQDSSDYSVPLEGVSEQQLALCHPEREFLPLVLAHCHYTLRRGERTSSSYDLRGVQTQLTRRFLSGKPLILADGSKYLRRRGRDFSAVLVQVCSQIPQEQLQGSVCSAICTTLRSFTDVCDATMALEVALRFLEKTGGDPQGALLPYLRDSLRMGQHIPSSLAKVLSESRLQHSVGLWQLLACWKSELRVNRGQDAFLGLGEEYRQTLTEEEGGELKQFLRMTDAKAFSWELHELLLLKTSNPHPEDNYPPHWDIRSTLENHLELKHRPPLPALDRLSEDLLLGQAAQIWKLTVQFKS